MLIQGQVGPISVTSSIAAGVQAPIRQGNMGEQIVSGLHGAYSEETYRRARFVVCNQTGVTHSAALSTTFVGICVGNPASSTVNLHIDGFGWTNEVALAAASSVGIMTGAGTITGALTPRNRYVGGAAGQGLATGGATIPGTPVLEQVFGTIGSTLAITSWQPQPASWVELKGGLILPPNTFVCSYMSTASGATGFRGWFTWSEVPI